MCKRTHVHAAAHMYTSIIGIVQVPALVLSSEHNIVQVSYPRSSYIRTAKDHIMHVQSSVSNCSKLLQSESKELFRELSRSEYGSFVAPVS